MLTPRLNRANATYCSVKYNPEKYPTLTIAFVGGRGRWRLECYPVSPRVLITGAGSGIGRACAELLTQSGAELILCDNDAQSLSLASETLGAVGRFCDVSSEASVAVLAGGCPAAYDSLDMIVNAAGGGYERTLGMYRVSRALIPVLKRARRGTSCLNIPPVERRSRAGDFSLRQLETGIPAAVRRARSETRGSTIRVLIGCPLDGQVTEVLPDRNARTWENGWDYDHGRIGDWDKLTQQIASLVGLSSDSDETRRTG
jgi:hypothetical protein